jgi:hypothetical protein
MKTKTLTLIFLTLSTLNSYCQVRQYGLIIPNDYSDDNICCIYSPREGFTVFNKPNGNKIGSLTRNAKSNSENESAYKIFFVDNKTNTDSKIDLKNFKEVGYEVMSITFFERKDGFVRIVNETVDYWLNEKEISDKNFSVIDWQQFYIEMSGQLMGFYANDPGLDLKTEPTDNSVTKETLQGDLYKITPTKETKGNWTKVKVKKYKEHPCGTDLDDKDNIEFEINGWIEVLDNDGQPNLWYYSRGC